MRKLLEFLLKGITGKEDFTIEENEEGDSINFEVEAGQDSIGMIIGRGGKNIRAIRNILKVRATLEKKGVSISVSET